MPVFVTNLVIRLRPVVETALIGLIMVVLNAVMLYVTNSHDVTFIGAYNVALAAGLNWLTSHSRDIYARVLEAMTAQPAAPVEPVPAPVVEAPAAQAPAQE